MLIYPNINLGHRDDLSTPGDVCAHPPVCAVILDIAGRPVCLIVPGGRFIRSQGAVVSFVCHLSSCLLSAVSSDRRVPYVFFPFQNVLYLAWRPVHPIFPGGCVCPSPRLCSQHIGYILERTSKISIGQPDQSYAFGSIMLEVTQQTLPRQHL